MEVVNCTAQERAVAARQEPSASAAGFHWHSTRCQADGVNLARAPAPLPLAARYAFHLGQQLPPGYAGRVPA